MEDIIPKIDTEVLREKANEYAQQGALSTIKEFYTGYNSPYKKAIEEGLKGNGVNYSFDLPDILGAINEGLTKEIDTIANSAIAKSFIPLVSKLLTRSDKVVSFSDILKEFIGETGYDYDEALDWEDYQVEFDDRENDDSFKYLNISNGEKGYRFGLSNKNKYNKDNKEPKWEIFTLPEQAESKTSRYGQRTMKLSMEGGTTLEIPFTPNVLHDRFISYIAGMVIAETEVKFDVRDFDEDMFPERGCTC